MSWLLLIISCCILNCEYFDIRDRSQYIEVKSIILLKTVFYIEAFVITCIPPFKFYFLSIDLMPCFWDIFRVEMILADDVTMTPLSQEPPSRTLSLWSTVNYNITIFIIMEQPVTNPSHLNICTGDFWNHLAFWNMVRKVHFWIKAFATSFSEQCLLLCMYLYLVKQKKRHFIFSYLLSVNYGIVISKHLSNCLILNIKFKFRFIDIN